QQQETGGSRAFTYDSKGFTGETVYQTSMPYPHLARGIERLQEVKALLETKQEIGGSTLSKLPKILDLVGPDDQLRDQYLHVGAGQTYRTTGRGVQMQNLKK